MPSGYSTPAITISASSGGKKLNFIKPLATKPIVKIRMEIEIYRGEYRKGKPFGDGQWTYSDGRTYTGKWIKGEFINEENKKDTMEFRLVTSIINFLAITFMLAVVVYWAMNVLNII